MKVRFILLTFALSFLLSCENNKKEAYQSSRDNIVDVKGKIEELHLGDDILLGKGARAYGIRNYLILKDYTSSGKMIHLYDKNSFAYIGSTGDIGQGPGEIISLGDVMVNEEGDKLLVGDLGHFCIYSYDIDSLISDKDYKPFVKYRLDKMAIPSYITYISDTLCYATFVIPIDSKSYHSTSGKWNMKTGEMHLMEYQHPDVKKREVNYVYSRKHNLFVEYHGRADLISIFDGDFNLKRNVYGPDWNDGDGKLLCFFPAVIYHDYIIAAYEGSLYREYKLPTKLHVFSIDGDYVKTLETGRKVHFMSADEDNERLILSFDDEMQFGFLDLKEFLD